MGLSKTQSFSNQQNSLANLAHAIGHPARIAILQYLASSSTCVCGDLVEVLPLAQATVSQHLKVLKQAGLIQGAISGPRTCYCIAPEAWKQARAMMDGFFQQVEQDNLCC